MLREFARMSQTAGSRIDYVQGGVNERIAKACGVTRTDFDTLSQNLSTPINRFT